jgi:hypothetical protein
VNIIHSFRDVTERAVFSPDLFIEAREKFEAWSIEEPFFEKFLCDGELW